MDLRRAIEHTLLRPDATEDDVRHVLDEAIRYAFFGVCIAPTWVGVARTYLGDHPQQAPAIVTVVGFPHGNSTSEAKCLEAERAVRSGAAEVDMVMNIGRYKSGQADDTLADIAVVVRASKAAGASIVKVILETGYLSADEIVTACELAERGGADFVKTSTGFGPRGASVDDVRLMMTATKGRLRVKASGGIRTPESARAMIAAGASRIGASNSVQLLG
jgi:deoxyribose-phosphate aldolase